MKKVSKLKAVIAATAAVAAITSVTAFASTTIYYNYNLAAGQTSPPQTHTADGDYLSLNTRPSAGSVDVRVTGYAIPGGEEVSSFPAAISRVDWELPVYRNLDYTVTVTAGLTNASGTLTMKTYD